MAGYAFPLLVHTFQSRQDEKTAPFPQHARTKYPVITILSGFIVQKLTFHKLMQCLQKFILGINLV